MPDCRFERINPASLELDLLHIVQTCVTLWAKLNNSIPTAMPDAVRD